MSPLHAALVNLRDNGPDMVYVGICGNIPASVNYPPRLIAAFKRWPEFSGDILYPVPHESLAPVHAFGAIHDVWEGAYGDARRRLLDFLIAECEEGRL